MNKAIFHAHGDYLNFMNSGDTYHSNFVLENVIAKSMDEDMIIGQYCNAETKKVLKSLKPNNDITLLSLLKETINHQSTFYKSSIFSKYKYDENLKIIADWKVNLQAIIFGNCTVKVIDTVVTDYDMTGISATNRDLFAKEWQIILDELIPKRIQKDYKRIYADDEFPIVTLLPQLKNSWRLQKIVYLFARLLLKLRFLGC